MRLELQSLLMMALANPPGISIRVSHPGEATQAIIELQGMDESLRRVLVHPSPYLPSCELWLVVKENGPARE